jgi:hypothetical protein
LQSTHALQASSEQRYLAIRADAENASGPLGSLRMRARGYLDIYQQSNGVCRFGLIAAHGALWASWYLICAKMASVVFAIFDPVSPLPRRVRYRQFAAYVTALKDINKLVMVETYVLVHTVQELGSDFAMSKGVPEDLARDYERAMRSIVKDEVLLRDLYHRHFLWEQQRVVSTKLDEAFAEFTWVFMRNLCQRPWVWFSYFKVGKSLNFKCFTDQAERVEKGLIAYDNGVNFGVERLVSFTDTRLRIFPGIAAWSRNIKRAVRAGPNVVADQI